MTDMKKEKDLGPMLEIKGLRVLFPVHKNWLAAVDGVDLRVPPGKIIGVVGESGSGKSVMSQSILRLRDHDTAVRYEGEILFEGEDLLRKPLGEMRRIRGNRISVIFQDPLNSLSPVHTVGGQLSEVLLLHKKMTKAEARDRSVKMLKMTGIPDPEDCMRKYPFELSGGMQQRVMIAMALACEPRLLIADEPTTALDVTIQEQILHLIRKLNEQLGMSVLFITHDMGAGVPALPQCQSHVSGAGGGRGEDRGTVWTSLPSLYQGTSRLYPSSWSGEGQGPADDPGCGPVAVGSPPRLPFLHPV